MTPQYVELSPECLFLAAIDGEVAHTRGRRRWPRRVASALMGPVARVAVVALPVREEL